MPYSCEEGASKWWSNEQKDWCCKNRGLGCGRNTEELNMKFQQLREYARDLPRRAWLLIGPTAMAAVALGFATLIIAVRNRGGARRREPRLRFTYSAMNAALSEEPLVSDSPGSLMYRCELRPSEWSPRESRFGSAQRGRQIW